MSAGQQWEFDTGENEFGIVLLGGTCSVDTSRGAWASIGRRPNVFSGMPYTLYLPRRTEVKIEAIEDGLDLGYGWCETDQDHPATLISPEEVHVELRGGGNATRQINDMIPPGFDCHRLVVVEVYTPSGNWSSYPPHKHDVHRESETGDLIEADLEETYFYKQDRPKGYAIQRVYTSDGGLDEVVLARHEDIVLVPEGYHPVVSAHGYTTYYLNFLVGSAQSLANTDDPDFAWVKETWQEQDKRLPIVSMDME
jgi:5-deoxy-glucuronate isomerase